MSKIININEDICVLTASEQPLSADVVLVYGREDVFIYDVGECDEAKEFIDNVRQPKLIVISHFHKDHMGNILRLDNNNIKKVYGGEFTINKINRQRMDLPGLHNGTDVFLTETITKKKEIIIGNTKSGEEVSLFYIPSSHSKGCTGLAVGEIAFLGDALYAAQKNERMIYNSSILHETIDCLNRLTAKNVYLSHGDSLIKKEVLISKLTRIYNLRKPDEAYIDVTGIE